jgi:heme-degrading monooxygenase HmoA
MKMAAAPVLAVAVPQQARTADKPPIQLHTDLHVKPEEEARLLEDFHALYLPRISKAPGFIEARLLKFRRANVGKAPEHFNYRLVQIFETEELRDAWTTAEGHKIAWHEAIESHVKVPFIAYLYDITAESIATRR